jgi:hypothetical protein
MPKPTSEQIEKFKAENPEELQTFDVPGVELFAVGTWNGDKYTTADLDEMVRAHAEIGDQLKPYMKLGHAPGQSLLKSDELPAAGWIENLRREGDRLVADIKSVPKRIYQLLKAKAYRRRSAEILCNFKTGDKAYRYALKACAFLGGEMPAVHSLNDVLALYAANGEVLNYGTDAAMKAYDLKEENHMDPKDQRIAELEKENAALKDGKVKEFSDKIAALTSEVTKLSDEKKAAESRATEAEGKLAAFAEKAENAEITSAVDGLIAKKKVAPAQKEAVFAMLKAAKAHAEKQYSVGGKPQGLEAIVKGFFENAPDLDVNTETESELGKAQNQDKVSRAKQYAAEHKVSFEDALIKVDKQDAEAAKAAA